MPVAAAAKKSLNWACGFTNSAASCTMANSMLPKSKYSIKFYPDGTSRQDSGKGKRQILRQTPGSPVHAGPLIEPQRRKTRL
jgi:hypothetical protein